MAAADLAQNISRTGTTELRKGLVLGIGNPLLDISAHTDLAFLEKYGLKNNDAILAEEKHLPMYDDLKAMSGVEYIAGGSTQNTMRMLQWVINPGHDLTATFMGSVGRDENARIVRQKAEESGLRIEYQQHCDKPTGTCAVVLTGRDRSLCANLAAANHFTIDHIKDTCNAQIVEDASLIYISAFFLTSSPETALEMGKHCSHREGKVFCMNLGAPFLSLVHKDRLMACFPYVDILFGNEDEFKTFAKVNNLDVDMTDFEAVAKAVSKMEHFGKQKRLTVLTQGKDPVIIACGDSVLKYPVVPVPGDKVVDTNGCGDAFVGGFLAMYVQGKDVEVATKCGLYCASEIIQRSGCSLPEKNLWKE